MPLQKGLLANQTTMSLDERFTQLRRGDIDIGARTRNDSRLQAATARNRRLALQMARRPAVIAALNLRRGRGMQRTMLGITIPGGLRGARFGRMITQRGNLRGLRRGQSFGRLSRSQSMQSLTGRSGLPMRSRGRGRGRLIRSGSVPRFNMRKLDGAIRRGTNNFRGRSRGSFRRGGFVGRGRGRGWAGGEMRGRGRGRGGVLAGRGRRPQPSKVPSKETLDQELDQYMASSRIVLDKEIDQYMNQPEGENWD